MSKDKHMDWICGIGAVVMVLVTLLVLGGGGTLLKAAAADMPYVNKLFSTDKVHEIDIVADEDDWNIMLENAMSEEYIACTAVIDGEKYANVGIRPKGNSSLSTVASSDSDRYSFKLEFDHYDKNSTYHGLDKLCLNNAIQDNTYMKDFLCYQMMNFLEADAPLSSFVWITVNGEDWGLYTAVEGIEDAFAQREYGVDHGQIYKPDSMDMGGGGRGAEARNRDGGQEEKQENGFSGEEAHQPEIGEDSSEKGFDMKGGRGGMNGSSDVLLAYSDDDPESYPNIFDNAVFDSVTDEDKERLVRSIKSLNEGDVESSVNVDEVLRYFAVHNFVLNGDSYTGSIIHNYYLYEDEGLLSMIAWDYNLAFGGMGMGGMGADGATSTVNFPIDSPVSDGDISERPMVSWIFDSREYTEQYHQVMDELISEFFESGRFETMIDETIGMLSPYVEKDPTAFCTYEEFQKGAETLKEFCLLRAESVRGQLSGGIPSTSEGQSEDNSGFVDASHLTVSDMGSQGGGMGMDQGFGRGRTAESAEETGAAMLFADEGQKGAGNGGRQPGGQDGTAPPDGEGGGMPPDMQGGEPPQSMEGGFPGGPGGQENGEAQPGGQESPVDPSTEEKAENSASQEAPAQESGLSENLPEKAEQQEENQNETGQNSEAPQAGEENQEIRRNDPPGGMGFPGGMEQEMPGGEAAEASSMETWLLLGGSCVLLLAGLLFAKFYR